MEKVATLLWELRSARNWSLSELARRSGISKAAVSQWESGARQPRIPELEAVLSALDANTSQRTRLLAAIEAPRALRRLRQTVSVEPPTAGDLLHSLRHRKGWTQEQLASRLNVSRAAVVNWEHGERTPSTEQIHAICYALDAHAEELIALSTGRCAETPTYSTTHHWEETLRGIEQDIVWLKHGPSNGLDELTFWTLERQAWERSVRDPTDPAVLPLLAYIYATHAQYYRTKERWTEIARYADKALALLDAAREVTPTRLWAGILRATAAAHGGEKPAPHRGFSLLSSEFPLAEGFPEYQAWILSDMAKFLKLDGQVEAGVDLTARAIGIARRAENPTELYLRRIDHARFLLEAGRFTEALRTLPDEGKMDEAYELQTEVLLLRAEAHFQDRNTAEAVNALHLATAGIGQHDFVRLRSEADLLAARF